MAYRHKPCPICKENAVVLVFSKPECKNCAYKWGNYVDYRDMYIGKVLPPTWTPTKPVSFYTEPVEDDNYVTSGDMQRDVEAVVETAALESEFMTVKRLASKIAKITEKGYTENDDPQRIINDVLVYITDEVKDAMKKNGRVVPDE